MASKYRNAGQTCVCANRIYVQDGVYDTFAEKLAAEVKKMKVGAGTEAGVTTGPLINKAAVEKVEEHVADALKQGAKVVIGGKRHELRRQLLRADHPRQRHAGDDGRARGDVRPGGAAVQVQDRGRGRSRMANDTPFGLAAYFYARDIGRVWRVAEALECGIVGINEGIISNEVAPVRRLQGIAASAARARTTASRSSSRSSTC